MKKYYLILIAYLLVFSACQKQPTACFNASSTSVKTGVTIIFTECSENSASYSWSFGDGKTSTDKNPTHSYSTSGTFTVTLTVSSDNEKKTDEATKTIIVAKSNTELLTGDWDYYKLIYTKYDDGFEDTSFTKNVTGWTWSFTSNGYGNISDPSGTETYTWKFNSDETKIIFYEGIDEFTYNIDKLTETDLELTNTETDNSWGYEIKEIYQLFFSKN